jgi:tetratricopeptide (TPR) repeat protein
MYDVAVVRDLGPAALPGLALLAVLAATALAFRRRPWIGFAGAWFFLLLAPTSSVLPIVTEPCADRRMYLPLLSFVVPLAVAARLRLGARTFCVAAAATAALLAWRTSAVAATYRDQATFVTHAAASNELANGSFLAGRILASHARVLHEAGRTAEAHAAVERAMRCEAPGRAERLALANVRQEQGRIDDAERALRALVRDYPDYPEAMGNLGGLLHDRATGLPPPAAAPLLDEAERWLARAVAAGPRRAEIQNSMGVLLHTRGRTAEAVPFLRRALELRPDFAEAARNLGIAWLVLDRPQDALAVLVPLLERSPGDPLLQQLVAAARERAQR